MVFFTVNIFIFTLGSSRGHKRRHSSSEESNSDPTDNEDETLNEQFRQGKNLEELGLEWGNNSENSVDPPDELNDSEWNMLGAALEKEFLDN